MTVRTTRFAGLTTAATTTQLLFTVPAGKRALVRAFSTYNGRVTAITSALTIVDPGSIVRAAVIRVVQPLASVELDPWFVLDAGDTLRVALTGGGSGNATVHAAGVLFDLP